MKTRVSNGIKLYTSQTKSEGATLLGVDRDTNVLKVGALIDKKLARFDVSYGLELESSASSIEGFSAVIINESFLEKLIVNMFNIQVKTAVVSIEVELHKACSRSN